MAAECIYHSPCAGPAYTPQWMNMPSLVSRSHWIAASGCCHMPWSSFGMRSGTSGLGVGVVVFAAAGLAAPGTRLAAVRTAAVPVSTVRRDTGFVIRALRDGQG